jgi:hypothetical protein
VTAETTLLHRVVDPFNSPARYLPEAYDSHNKGRRAVPQSKVSL